MKIILANKFYYPRGGDCIYMLSLEKLLKSHGHEIAVFAMQYPENDDSIWSKYWPCQMTSLRAFSRPFGDKEVRTKFTSMLNDFKPDVVHLNNIHTQLSPVIAEIAHENGVKVVWTLHDTKLVCPAYTCQRNGEMCEECFSNKMAILRHRCLPGNIIGAFIGWREILKWNRERLESCSDIFISPSIFLKQTMVRGGYSPKKIKVLCNFIDIYKVSRKESKEKRDYYVFLGRVDDYKGIRTLCRAATQLPFKLKVIGGGPLLNELIVTYKDCKQIEFVGKKTWDELSTVLAQARLMVLPSECSENNPLTIIEAQSLGTPVLGSKMGGIPELVEEGVTGMTFESRNVEDLKNKIQTMWNTTWNYENIAHLAQERYGAEKYYQEIIKIYKL